MRLRVIGAGLPRTGTTSLREGLPLLLGGPIHHMSEVFAHPELAGGWARALDGEPPPWKTLLGGYVGAVDVPAAMCWRELAAAYPDALIVLSHREDAATWHRSMAATVLPRTREMLRRPDDPVTPVFERMFYGLVPDLDDLDDPARAAAAYRRWNDTVMAEAPSDRLLVWQPSDGWEPLCRALDLPVPDVAFPHLNSTADHRARHRDREVRDAVRRAEADPPP